MYSHWFLGWSYGIGKRTCICSLRSGFQAWALTLTSCGILKKPSPLPVFLFIVK